VNDDIEAVATAIGPRVGDVPITPPPDLFVGLAEIALDVLVQRGWTKVDHEQAVIRGADALQAIYPNWTWSRDRWLQVSAAVIAGAFD
jgi:hypothetical protein